MEVPQRKNGYNMERVCKYGQMEQNMTVIGKMAKFKVKGFWFMEMEM